MSVHVDLMVFAQEITCTQKRILQKLDCQMGKKLLFYYSK